MVRFYVRISCHQSMFLMEYVESMGYLQMTWWSQCQSTPLMTRLMLLMAWQSFWASSHQTLLSFGMHCLRTWNSLEFLQLFLHHTSWLSTLPKQCCKGGLHQTHGFQLSCQLHLHPCLALQGCMPRGFLQLQAK